MAGLRDADPRQLAALVAVVDHGTFSRAASALGFTQSAISQQIAQLERAARTSLFDRPKGPRAAQLTPTGRVLVEYARRTLTRIDEMDERLDLMRRGVAGRLVIGTFQSASALLLPNILGQMRRELPDIDIRLDETDDLDELERDVLADETDLAFTVDLAPDPRLSIDVLGRDPFVVIAPTTEAEGPTVAADELNRHPLIGQPEGQTGQQMVDERLLAVGIRPEFTFRFQNNSAVQSMVRSGMGWAVMPSLAIDHDDPGIVVLNTDPPLRPRVIQLIAREGRTLLPAADRFRAVARESSSALLEADDVASGTRSERTQGARP